MWIFLLQDQRKLWEPCVCDVKKDPVRDGFMVRHHLTRPKKWSGVNCLNCAWLGTTLGFANRQIKRVQNINADRSLH